MEKVEKALDNYVVVETIIDLQQEIYNENIAYRNNITEKLNKIEGEMKAFHKGLKKFKLLNYNQSLNHIV